MKNKFSMKSFLWNKRVLFIIISILFILILDNLYAEVLGNYAHKILIDTIIYPSEQNCEELDYSTTLHLLQIAADIQPERSESWRTLLKIKGIVDREWIRDEINNVHTTDIRMAIDRAEFGLLPPARGLETLWNWQRCQMAYGAWTLGLISSLEGDWEYSIASYQAGVSLAIGKVNSSIMREYYRSLANYVLSSNTEEVRKLIAAAKYYLMAGDEKCSYSLLVKIFETTTISLTQCISIKRVHDLQKGNTIRVEDDLFDVLLDCDTYTNGFSDISDVSFEWAFPVEVDLNKDVGGNTLIGFDLDHDILEAGVEVLGTYYWQTSSGNIEKAHFHEPNLWPNSSNSWLSLHTFTECIPGYYEPPWVDSCAGSVMLIDDPGSRYEVVGRLNNPIDQGPDALLSTSSLDLVENRVIVYGGRFFLEGDFPQGHLAQAGMSSEHPFYQPVLFVSDLPKDRWVKQLNIFKLDNEQRDIQHWIRPRVGTGSGVLKFDDIFAFYIPIE